MQPNMQQIPQPQMQMPNPQQIPPQNQLYQIVQTNSTPNRCEKFSNWLTGSRNIPLVVFLILMSISGAFILNLVCDSAYFTPFLSFSSLGNFLFALCVWTPMAVKIERNTSTVRYGYLYILNCSILCALSFSIPLSLNKLWCFVLFETLLIALSNIDKKMKFFCCKLKARPVIILTLVYNLFFNWYYFFSLIITVAYTFVYQKYLIKKFGLSNERIERIENWCLINGLKNKLLTFITIKDVLDKGQQNQPLVQNSNIQNSGNSSFVPVNMYPNYYSGIVPGIQQMQSIPQSEGIRTVEPNNNQQPQ